MNNLRRSAEDATGPGRWPRLPYAVFAAITLILAVPLLRHFQNWGIRDWDLFTTLHAAAVRSVIEYGQFPFWNPFIGGGNILFAHPEVPALNPLFALLLIFGPLAGLKLQILVVYFLGMVGFYKLSRQLGISYRASFLPPVVYMLSSYLALHFSAGHIPFHYFSFLPWLVFFYKKSLTRPVHILSAGGVTAFIILGSGAAVPLLFSLFFMFLVSLLDVGRGYGIRPPLFAVAGGICGILFAAVKFFPMFDYLARNPWLPERMAETTSLSIMPSMYFSFHQSNFSDFFAGEAWGWHEYGAFIGPVVVLLAAAALLMRFRNNWRYLVLVIISLVLVAGSFWGSFSPYDLLHRLPGFASTRVPSRFSLLALFAVAILAGKGLDVILSKMRSGKSWAAAGITAAVLATHLVVCLPILAETFIRAPEQAESNTEFKHILGDPNRMYAAFLGNRGTLRAAWLSAYRPAHVLADYDGRPLEWYAEDDKVTVTGRTFTPNRIVFQVRAGEGGTLVAAQNYDRGWRRADGGLVKSYSDLVSVYVTPADREIELYYFPDYFITGLLVSVISILLALAAAFRWRRSGHEAILD